MENINSETKWQQRNTFSHDTYPQFSKIPSYTAGNYFEQTQCIIDDLQHCSVNENWLASVSSSTQAVQGSIETLFMDSDENEEKNHEVKSTKSICVETASCHRSSSKDDQLYDQQLL